jgi:hypothetical protein
MAIQKAIRTAIIFSFFLLVIPFSYAVLGLDFTSSTLYWIEDFNYDDLFTNHWHHEFSVTAGCGGSANYYPISADYYGYNCTAAGLSPISYLLNSNWTKAGIPNVRINFSQGANQYLTLKTRYFLGDNGSYDISFRSDRVSEVLINIPLGKANENFTGKLLWNAEFAHDSYNCSWYITRNEWHDLAVYFDFESLNYRIYQDDELSCSGAISPLDKSIGAIYIYKYGIKETNNYILMDYISMNYTEFSFEEIIPTNDLLTLFCDDFNYPTSMYSTKGWLVSMPSGAVDTSLAPIDNQLTFYSSDSSTKIPSHNTDKTSYLFKIGENVYTESIFSPVYSSEFYLNLTSEKEDGCLSYLSTNGYDWVAYDFDICPNGSVYWSNTTDLNKHELCTSCFSANTTTFFKFSTFFKQRDGYPFNSTIAKDKIVVSIDTTEYTLYPDYWDTERITTLGYYSIYKHPDTSFTLDDYCVYIGTDKDVDTIPQFFEPLYNPYQFNESIIVSPEPVDLIEQIQSLYDILGLKSAGSRILAGLIFLVVCNMVLLYFAFSFNTDIPAIVYAIMNIIGCFALVYVGLIPYWIVIIIAIILIAGLMFLFLRAISSGS